MNKECPNCLNDLTQGQYFDYCKFCGYEIDKREQLWAPSPFDNKEYDLKTLDNEHGYIFYFKEGEPKMFGKEPHVHVQGHGREIEYYLSPLRIKRKKPKNFPQGEESKIYQVVKKRKDYYLQE